MEAKPDEVSPLRLQLLLARLFSDATGGLTTLLVSTGLSHGLFNTLARDACTVEALSSGTGLPAPFVRLWTETIHEAGYISSDGEVYFLTAEQRRVFVELDGSWAGAAHLVAGFGEAMPKLENWLAGGTPPSYGRKVTSGLDGLTRVKIEKWMGEWLALAPDFSKRLEGGASCVDLGCGSGRLTEALRHRFPSTTVMGLDLSFAALAGGVGGGTACAGVEALRGGELFASFESFHHFEEPVRVMDKVGSLMRETGGRWLLIEPRTSDEGPLRQYLAAMSALFCLPDTAGRGAGLGAFQAAESLIDSADMAGLEVMERGETEQHIVAVLGPE